MDVSNNQPDSVSVVSNDAATQPALWMKSIALFLPAGLAFLLYGWTLAPGITWAHQGADGAELLAAAVTNGVPHPPGYPLYMLLLRGWLWLTSLLLPGAELAWRGNLLSAFYGALSVVVTTSVAARVTASFRQNSWLWAGLIGALWAICPLLWSQTIITEVYALHALLLSLLGWALLAQRGRPRYLIPVVALGIAHHLTFVLLLPASLYYVWSVRMESSAMADGEQRAPLRVLLESVLLFSVGGLLGLLVYLRTPLAALNAPPSPINWGYPDNWRGFWWLVSGAAYQGYLFNVPQEVIFERISAWAYHLTWQFTPLGLALALTGLAHWDQTQPRLRNFSILWVVPVSIYSISYFTRDSEIYLLPVLWLVLVWSAVGLAVAIKWIEERQSGGREAMRTFRLLLGGVGMIGILILVAVRLPDVSLRGDAEARNFVQGAAVSLEPNSIVISENDAETFALWYGAWGSGELLAAAPNTVFVNHSLLQFDWYQRLMRKLYPDLNAAGQPVHELIAANAGQRPIFLSEQLSIVPPETLQPAGSLWRYVE